MVLIVGAGVWGRLGDCRPWLLRKGVFGKNWTCSSVESNGGTYTICAAGSGHFGFSDVWNGKLRQVGLLESD